MVVDLMTINWCVGKFNLRGRFIFSFFFVFHILLICFVFALFLVAHQCDVGATAPHSCYQRNKLIKSISLS